MDNPSKSNLPVTVRVSIFFAYCLAAVPLLAADGDWTRQADVSVDSKLMRRGIERAGATVTPVVRLADGSWKFAAQLAMPFEAASRSELGLSAGYTYATESGVSCGWEVAHFQFGDAPLGHASRATELTVSLSLPAGPGRLVASFTHEVDQGANIGELSYAGEYALKSWGAFLNYRVYLGSVRAEDALPDLLAPRVGDSYAYHGLDLTLPYRIGGQTVLSAGVHYAGTNGARPFWSPGEASPGGKVWVSLAASYEF